MPEAPNGWNEWSQYVLAELKRLNGCYTGLGNKTNDILIEIATLKGNVSAMARFWGIIGGAIPILIGLGIWIIRTR